MVFFFGQFFIVPKIHLCLSKKILLSRSADKKNQVVFFLPNQNLAAAATEKMQKLKSLTVSNLRHLAKEMLESQTFIMAYYLVVTIHT